MYVKLALFTASLIKEPKIVKSDKTLPSNEANKKLRLIFKKELKLFGYTVAAVIAVFTERPSAIIFVAHIIKEHVYSIGAGFLQSFIERLHRLVVVGSIKTKLFEIFHLRIGASKPWKGGRRREERRRRRRIKERKRGGGEEKVEREMKGLKGEKLQSCMFSSYLQLCIL